MNFTFNHYNQLEDPGVYLCNPDCTVLSAITANDRKLSLRFNDLSGFSFTVSAGGYAYNDVIKEYTPSVPAWYNYLETKRIIFVEDVGYFQITNVSETDDGAGKHKEVTCESLETMLKNKGFVTENRPYVMFNDADKQDVYYDSNDPASIPSIVGQMYRQLGIQLDLEQGDATPESEYLRWTITYISEDLRELHRTFQENTTFGYDFLKNEAQEAFECIFCFDYYYKTIKIKTVEEITSEENGGHLNIYMSFDNIVKELNVTEEADGIITVMNCKGQGIDITQVNPMGTNYLVDFSNYMDKNGRWMSAELIAKLEAWQEEYENNKDNYAAIVTNIEQLYTELVVATEDYPYYSLKVKDLEYAQQQRLETDESGTGYKSKGDLIIVAEEVTTERASMKDGDGVFDPDEEIMYYANQPNLVSKDGKTYFEFSGEGQVGTPKEFYDGKKYYYQAAGDGNQTYRRIEGSAKKNNDTNEFVYTATGYTRYVTADQLDTWLSKYQKICRDIERTKNNYESQIKSKEDMLSEISNSINILNYIRRPLNGESKREAEALLAELECYWFEGEYTNDHIAINDNMDGQQIIELSKELMKCGQTELSKVSRPRFSFSINAQNFFMLKDFEQYVREIELGKVVMVEKSDDVIYYPAVLEMEFGLDDPDDFSITFGTRLKLDDWGYTFADLITSADSTSKTVNSNWYELMSYSRNKEDLTNIIKNPLDSTLRVGMENAVNQEFQIDTHGILGRKFVPSDSANEDDKLFESEQMMITNNLILFTDDNWATAKTALGKVVVDGESSYGLIAETIIGNLIVGSRLSIIDEEGYVSITGDGITIMDSNKKILLRAGRKLNADGTVYIDDNGNTCGILEIGGETSISGNCIRTGKIDASRLDLADCLTVTKLNNGTTIINGGWIETGTIKADRLATVTTEYDDGSNNMPEAATTIQFNSGIDFVSKSDARNRSIFNLGAIYFYTKQGVCSIGTDSDGALMWRDRVYGYKRFGASSSNVAVFG